MKYPALKTIAAIFQLEAVLVGGLSLIVISYLYKIDMEIWWLILIFIASALHTLIILAISESIKVLIDIEKNTRETAINSLKNEE